VKEVVVGRQVYGAAQEPEASENYRKTAYAAVQGTKEPGNYLKTVYAADCWKIQGDLSCCIWLLPPDRRREYDM
jgi:hypothetical protein